MTCYAIGLRKVTDGGWLPEYRAHVGALVERHGGKYLTRTGDVEWLEGGGDLPDLFVVIEFPSKQAARAFIEDPEYQPYQKMRLAGSTGDLYLVAREGMS